MVEQPFYVMLQDWSIAFHYQDAIEKQKQVIK
jgi:hypothetical protein